MATADEKKKILLVDDDLSVLEIYVTKFTSDGFIIETAASGLVALTKIKTGFDPDVFIVDIQMPGMDGIEFVKEIKSRKLLHPVAKIVILTNKPEPGYVEISRDLGVDGYIVKTTVVPSEVVSMVRQIMAGKKIFSVPKL